MGTLAVKGHVVRTTRYRPTRNRPVVDARSGPGLCSVSPLRGEPGVVLRGRIRRREARLLRPAAHRAQRRSSNVIGPLSPSSRGCFRSKGLCSSTPTGLCCGSKSLLARSLCAGACPPLLLLPLLSSARPWRPDDAPVPTVAPALCQHRVGGAPAAVLISLRRCSVAALPCLPTGFGKGHRQAFRPS